MSEVKYEDFCRETCTHYKTLKSLEGRFDKEEDNFISLLIKLVTAKIHCRYDCGHTKDEFYLWITKANN